MEDFNSKISLNWQSICICLVKSRAPNDNFIDNCDMWVKHTMFHNFDDATNLFELIHFY